ncbi:hypothetical protein WMY93_015566 [Mugilogobius chulae]|uniref:Uncharacterized protein n=1 Tax=Mugilogobius chulae TaxID=88201 RepID=A0AAW0NV44_9GOBI
MLVPYEASQTEDLRDRPPAGARVRLNLDRPPAGARVSQDKTWTGLLLVPESGLNMDLLLVPESGLNTERPPAGARVRTKTWTDPPAGARVRTKPGPASCW